MEEILRGRSRVLKRRLPNHLLFIPRAAAIERPEIPSVVRVELSESNGRDPMFGADPGGTARGLGTAAMAGLMCVGSGRRTSIGMASEVESARPLCPSRDPTLRWGCWKTHRYGLALRAQAAPGTACFAPLM